MEFNGLIDIIVWSAVRKSCLFFICLQSGEISMRGDEQMERWRDGKYWREETKGNERELMDYGKERSVSMLFMHELRTQQDLIFSETTEIYNLLNQPPAAQLQGLTYAEINSSERLTHALMLMRNNAPAYQHMSQRKKTYYMKDLAKCYKQKMKICKDDYAGEEARLVGDLSEGQSNRNTNQSSPKRQPQKTAKVKTIKKAKKNIQNLLPKAKRISFLTQSDCKYFSSPNPPFAIQTLPLHFFPTS